MTLSSVRHETIASDRAGQRLDNYLMGLPEKPPRSLVYRIIRKGQVRVNGKRAKPMQKLVTGDEIRIPPLESAKERAKTSEVTQQRWGDLLRDWQIDQGEGWVAFDKPAGLAMHGGSGVSVGLIDMIQAQNPSWQLVHRLDRGTSGIVLVATNRNALIRLQQAFKERTVEKKYLTLLSGRLQESQIIVDQPLKKIKDASGQHRMIIDSTGQTAKTIFKVLELFNAHTYCEVTIETGRMHQIRAHAAFINHAVAGDERYNKNSAEKGLNRLFLHAHQLTLPEPDAQVIGSPLPVELKSFLDRLRVH